MERWTKVLSLSLSTIRKKYAGNVFFFSVYSYRHQELQYCRFTTKKCSNRENIFYHFWLKEVLINNSKSIFDIFLFVANFIQILYKQNILKNPV